MVYDYTPTLMELPKMNSKTVLALLVVDPADKEPVTRTEFTAELKEQLIEKGVLYMDGKDIQATNKKSVSIVRVPVDFVPESNDVNDAFKQHHESVRHVAFSEIDTKMYSSRYFLRDIPYAWMVRNAVAIVKLFVSGSFRIQRKSRVDDTKTEDIGPDKIVEMLFQNVKDTQKLSVHMLTRARMGGLSGLIESVMTLLSFGVLEELRSAGGGYEHYVRFMDDPKEMRDITTNTIEGIMEMYDALNSTDTATKVKPDPTQFVSTDIINDDGKLVTMATTKYYS